MRASSRLFRGASQLQFSPIQCRPRTQSTAGCLQSSAAHSFPVDLGSTKLSFASVKRYPPCRARYATDYAQQARDLNQKGLDEQEAQLEDALEEEKEKQVRAPWHREGADQPPVKRNRSAGAMTKGPHKLNLS